MLPSGKSNEFYRAEFIKHYGEAKHLTDPLNEPVLLSLRGFLRDKTATASQVWKFTSPGHGESIPLLRKMIEEPLEIWLTPQINKAGKIRLTKRYVSLWKSTDKTRTGGLTIFEVVDGEFKGVTSFLPFDKKGRPDLKYLERQRKGLLLFGR